MKYRISTYTLNEVEINFGDEAYTTDVGIVNLHLTIETPWVANIHRFYFDLYGCSRPQKLSRFIIKRSATCLYSDYTTQGLAEYCAAYCLYKISLTKIKEIDFESAV